jgi:hypothetical protein
MMPKKKRKLLQNGKKQIDGSKIQNGFKCHFSAIVDSCTKKDFLQFVLHLLVFFD